MPDPRRFRTELVKTLALAYPIMAGQVGQMLMGLVDTLMVGHVGTSSLAAAAFVNCLMSVAFVFGIGVLTSVGVLIFGNAGAPALGLVGAGWATFVSRIVTMTGTLLFCVHVTGSGCSVLLAGSLSLSTMRSLLTLGLPVGFQYLSGLIMLIFARVYGILGNSIANAFNSDSAVVGLTSNLLLIAGLFQIADGVQVTAMGGLRGLADVRVPMILAFIYYWLGAIPIGYVAAFVFGAGAVGIWAGLATGLFIAAITLTIRFFALTASSRMLLFSNPLHTLR